jgi:hypothetical protein
VEGTYGAGGGHDCGGVEEEKDEEDELHLGGLLT